MEISNGILKIKVDTHGAELKSAIMGDREYMWCGDEKWWGRTSPILFPFVGRTRDGKYTLDGKEYPQSQHGFARDMVFELVEKGDTSLAYRLTDTEDTMAKYPFKFELLVGYAIENNKVKVSWAVKNNNDRKMPFSIGAHPAFNLKPDGNYFRFDAPSLIYKGVDGSGLEIPGVTYTTGKDGYEPIVSEMFDSDALIVEDEQAHEVSLCDKDKKPYVTVKFEAPLFGLWHPVGRDVPFVCIEPWYGRCDRNNFEGDLYERDYTNIIEPYSVFKAEYIIEFN